MDDGTEFIPFRVVGGRDGDLAGFGAFAPIAPAEVDPGAERDPAGHAMEPSRQRIRIVDRARPAGQQQERRLERILGQVAVGQQMATDAQHHRPMPLDQGRERRLGCLTTVGELIEQAAIGRCTQRPDVEERANLLVQSDRRIPV